MATALTIDYRMPVTVVRFSGVRTSTKITYKSDGDQPKPTITGSAILEVRADPRGQPRELALGRLRATARLAQLLPKLLGLRVSSLPALGRVRLLGLGLHEPLLERVDLSRQKREVAGDGLFGHTSRLRPSGRSPSQEASEAARALRRPAKRARPRPSPRPVPCPPPAAASQPRPRLARLREPLHGQPTPAPAPRL